MIVQKFGGTSVGDVPAIARLAAIVREARSEHPVVVVSAMGDTTDRLVESLGLASRGDAKAALEVLEGVRRRTLEVAAVATGSAPEVEEELAPLFGALVDIASAVAILRSVPPDADDLFLAHGELVSSRVVARALRFLGLPAVWVDARTALVTTARFGRAQPDLERTRVSSAERLRVPVARGDIPVVAGFVGATPEGRTTILGRGGSDYSAAIFAAVLEARRVEIWTDVDGMMTADPRIVAEARVVARISAEEASELAYFGARVLHPLTLAPAIERGIPVHVRNSRHAERPGTEIHAGPAGSDPQDGDGARSIACKKGIATVDVATSRMLMASGFLRTLFDVFARHDTAVDMVTTSEVSVSVTVDDPGRLSGIQHDLEEIASVEIATGRAIVCLVGENLKFTPGVAARIFRSLGNVNVLMISQGASRRNVSFVVAEEDADRAVRLLHAEFFGPAARMSGRPESGEPGSCA